ncbi:hypothetical protein [Burkholderia sp.]|uniref:hypothetical protein n=1 Tax=Burkholderia sp. TaxID=36773 RepID=UPI0025C71598|nr:hypothetical protein [Burkholderia sp.]MBS6361218.1 hypothetical protein [Burkholderia sp.]
MLMSSCLSCRGRNAMFRGETALECTVFQRIREAAGGGVYPRGKRGTRFETIRYNNARRRAGRRRALRVSSNGRLSTDLVADRVFLLVQRALLGQGDMAAVHGCHAARFLDEFPALAEGSAGRACAVDCRSLSFASAYCV